ncbi:hypothetical protein ACFQI9_07370 [Paraburkholderia dipogonis]|uniref:hypothetical protein n=1 Tax=Paraburkholderia dipogonis TaxID=1211383 RepID=UPI00360C5E51
MDLLAIFDHHDRRIGQGESLACAKYTGSLRRISIDPVRLANLALQRFQTFLIRDVAVATQAPISFVPSYTVTESLAETTDPDSNDTITPGCD